MTEEDDNDKSLDDFFAKKDKSKKPKKKKKTKSDETDLSQSEKQSKKPGDGWNDFEEAKEKDYSNLKIQTLQIVEDNAKEAIEEESGGNECNDEDGVEKKRDDGKWSLPAAANVETQLITEPKDLPGTHNVVGGKYIPPSLKRSMMAPSRSPMRGKPLSAPDIKSKAAFPTLSAANQDISMSTPNKSNDFEIVKRGMKTSDARIEDNKPRLDLVNRYDSLRN